MGRLWAGCFGILVGLSLLPSPVSAQDPRPEVRAAPMGESGRTCRSVRESDFRRILNTRGEATFYFRDPVRFLCTGNVLLEADSAVLNRTAATVELIGNVLYRDSTRELRADWANYLGRMDQLLTRGSTTVRDLENGAVVEGEQLNYLRETEERPLARMIVTGGRPHAIIPPEPPRTGDTTGLAPPPPDTASVPTEVWGDRLELEGNDLFRARRNVDIARGAMTGGGQTALFDRVAERMTLTGDAFVENEDYRLEGDRIVALLEGDGLREVRSHGSARVVSEELNVESQQVRIGFTEGRVERLEAWNPPGEEREETPRARANARDFRLRADSMDVWADSVGIQELRAVGRAYGERGVEAVPRDGTDPLPPTLATDWVQGDTILGFFAHLDAAAGPDPAEVDLDLEVAPDRIEVVPDQEGGAAADSGEVVLERIEVVGEAGNHALSLYRQEPDEAEGPPTLNFIEAIRIILFMEQGDVARVEVEGPLEGLYLDPAVAEPAGGAASGGAAGQDGR